MTGGKTVNPHMLRHWYATDMIRRGVNPEVVRRQMRHKNVSVTLKIYTQVRSDEIEASLPNRTIKDHKPLSKINSNIIEFKPKMTGR
jgi:site-specific recombinase XerD